MTDLETIQAGWNRAAVEDAFFNICTHPERQNGGWDAESFFAHGRVEIDDAMTWLEDHGIKGRGRALDFGCGVGRLSQALARHYKHVDGVDLSPEMIRLARKHNRAEDCNYHVNVNPDLACFMTKSYDLVYTNIVLQHMPQELAEGYVKEFIRLLKPSGAARFHIPAGQDSVHPNPWLSMWNASEDQVDAWVWEAGGQIIGTPGVDGLSNDCYVAKRR